MIGGLRSRIRPRRYRPACRPVARRAHGAARTHRVRRPCSSKPGETPVRESLLLQEAHLRFGAEALRRFVPIERLLVLHQLLGSGRETRDRSPVSSNTSCWLMPDPEGVGDVEDPLRAGLADLLDDVLAIAAALGRGRRCRSPTRASAFWKLSWKGATRSPSPRRPISSASSDARIGRRELLEGEARNLRDDVIDRRLERSPASRHR